MRATRILALAALIVAGALGALFAIYQTGALNFSTPVSTTNCDNGQCPLRIEFPEFQAHNFTFALVNFGSGNTITVTHYAIGSYSGNVNWSVGPKASNYNTKDVSIVGSFVNGQVYTLTLTIGSNLYTYSLKDSCGTWSYC